MIRRQGASNESVQRERLSGEDYMYCLYWIRLEAHTNIHTEGYVGITTNIGERMRAHKKCKRDTYLYNSIRKYGWDSLTIDIVIENITQEEVLFLEELYRPTQRIGWNSQKGGELGVESEWYSIKENADKHRIATAVATKLAIAEKDTTERRSQRGKQSHIDHADSYRDISLGSKNPRAILDEKAVKVIKYKLIPQGLSNKEIGVMFNVKGYVIQFIRTGKNWKHV